MNVQPITAAATLCNSVKTSSVLSLVMCTFFLPLFVSSVPSLLRLFPRPTHNKG
jgi:hypothetical protein